MTISVLGAGAFGTALAITFARGEHNVILWGRNLDAVQNMRNTRENKTYLAGISFPESLEVTHDLKLALSSDIICLSVPMQKLGTLLSSFSDRLENKKILACCKGIHLATSEGPSALISKYLPGSTVAVLTGPSFARDMAQGLPTALTLACKKPEVCEFLQESLSTKMLRIYRTTDVKGAELGGALKNVIAIACGVAIGAGYGESARAALMTRGYSEILQIALLLGAEETTLCGLSGFGDLCLTCMSSTSRNFSYGFALGRGVQFDASITVEGISTATAALRHSELTKLDMPIIRLVHQLATGTANVTDALQILMSRPQKRE